MIVNALQRRADVVVQKSLAEGFGLTVTEAMWKRRPLVASRVGGIQDRLGRAIVLFQPQRLRLREDRWFQGDLKKIVSQADEPVSQAPEARAAPDAPYPVRRCHAPMVRRVSMTERAMLADR